jgi:hypothetical protein
MGAAVSWIFDDKRPEAVAAAQKQAGRLITRTGLTEIGTVAETKAAIRETIVSVIREGLSPVDAARQIREMIGLSRADALAAKNERSRLIRSGLSQARVDTLMEQWVERKIKYRALLIAQTETMEALRLGSRMGIAQALSTGLMLPTAEKEWTGSGYVKGGKGAAKGRRFMCDICAPMVGKRVPVKGKFTLPDGRKVDGPGVHPRCGCGVRIWP